MNHLIKLLSPPDLHTFVINLLDFVEDYQKQPHWLVENRLLDDAQIAEVVKKHTGWDKCKAINITHARRRYKDGEKYRSNGALKVIEGLLAHYKLEPVEDNKQLKREENPKGNYLPKTYQFQPQETHLPYSIASKFHLYKGIYIGYFLRSGDGCTDEVTQLALIFRPNGRANYRSDLNTIGMEGDFTFHGTNILKAAFKDEKNTAFFQYILNAIPDKDNSEKPPRFYLDGLFVGSSEISRNLPASGIIRLRREHEWQDDNPLAMEKLYETLPLRSYDLNQPEEVATLLDITEEPFLMQFFMGMTPNFYSRLRIETIQSFMNARLVPRFEAEDHGLEGYYVAMRIGTKRRNFFKRAVQIFKDGRVCLELEVKTKKEKTRLNTYWGRVHRNEDKTLTSISIDRLCHAGKKDGVVNRTLYVYKTTSGPLPIGSYIFGLAVILDTEDTIRAGHEVLQRVDKETFDNIDKSQALKIKGLDLKEDIEIDIFNYLRKFPILKAEHSPLVSFNETQGIQAYADVQPEYGIRCFESACLAALKQDKLTMLNRLKEALKYGFSDVVYFMKELSKFEKGALSLYEKDLKPVFIERPDNEYKLKLDKAKFNELKQHYAKE
jgi:hypothetical protein